MCLCVCLCVFCVYFVCLQKGKGSKPRKFLFEDTIERWALLPMDLEIGRLCVCVCVCVCVCD